MANFSTLSGLGSVLVQNANQRASDKNQRVALEQQQSLQEQNAIQDANDKKDQLALAEQINATERNEKLASQTAAQRARLGALGILGSGGTGDVILRNLLADNKTEADNASAAYQLKTKAIDQDVNNLIQRNLLQRQQLFDRQSLTRWRITF